MLSRIALTVLCLSAAGADELKRHAAIGLAVGPAEHAVVVQRVLEGGAGAAAGILAGDVIQSMDGISISGTEQFVRSVAGHLGGDSISLVVGRGGESITKTVKLRPKPYETSPVADILYESVAVPGVHGTTLRRTIISKPKTEGRRPAVLLMGGLGCYSVDNEDPTSGYGRILSEFQRKGFVTMRVEKTGEGDSEGPACTDPAATPQLEADGYIAGLRALKKHPFVDPARVFVFAHSLGPVIGSLVLPREPVRGFMAIETIGTSWYEYDLERVRLQESLDGKPFDEVDRAVREYEVCSHRFFVEKEKPEELAKTPACRSVLIPIASVPYTYMQAIGDISLAAQWKSVDIPVLVVYGTASPVTTARQNQYLAEMINSFHPGRATYVEVPGMGHDFGRYESMRDYHQHHQEPHPFHAGVIEVVMKWLDAQS